jgi:hypothetical protein
MANSIIFAGIRKSGQLLSSAALAATIAGAIGMTARVACLGRDLVPYFTSCSSGPQTWHNQMPLDCAISTYGNFEPPRLRDGKLRREERQP